MLRDAFTRSVKDLQKGGHRRLTFLRSTPKARRKARNTSAATRENGDHETSVRSFTFWENELDTVSKHRSMFIYKLINSDGARGKGSRHFLDACHTSLLMVTGHDPLRGVGTLGS